MTTHNRNRTSSSPTEVTDTSGAKEWFWALAEELLAQPGVTRSTMMGLACLRIDERFFASLDLRTGCLVVKLDQADVEERCRSGQGLPFAPAGRVFREWVAIPPENLDRWRGQLERALAFVGGLDREDEEGGASRPKPLARTSESLPARGNQ